MVVTEHADGRQYQPDTASTTAHPRPHSAAAATGQAQETRIQATAPRFWYPFGTPYCHSVAMNKNVRYIKRILVVALIVIAALTAATLLMPRAGRGSLLRIHRRLGRLVAHQRVNVRDQLVVDHYRRLWLRLTNPLVRGSQMLDELVSSGPTVLGPVRIPFRGKQTAVECGDEALYPTMILGR